MAGASGAARQSPTAPLWPQTVADAPPQARHRELIKGLRLGAVGECHCPSGLALAPLAQRRDNAQRIAVVQNALDEQALEMSVAGLVEVDDGDPPRQDLYNPRFQDPYPALTVQAGFETSNLLWVGRLGYVKSGTQRIIITAESGAVGS